jgi:hypothetical protein
MRSQDFDPVLIYSRDKELHHFSVLMMILGGGAVD